MGVSDDNKQPLIAAAINASILSYRVEKGETLIRKGQAQANAQCARRRLINSGDVERHPSNFSC